MLEEYRQNIWRPTRITAKTNVSSGGLCVATESILNDKLSEDVRTVGSVDRERGRQLQGSWTAVSNPRRISLCIYSTVSCLFTLQTRHEASRLAPYRLLKETLFPSCHTTARNILSSSWRRNWRCDASVRKSEMGIKRKAHWGILFLPEPQMAAAFQGKKKILKSSLRFFQMDDPSKCFLDTRGGGWFVTVPN